MIKIYIIKTYVYMRCAILIKIIFQLIKYFQYMMSSVIPAKQNWAIQ